MTTPVDISLGDRIDRVGGAGLCRAGSQTGGGRRRACRRAKGGVVDRHRRQGDVTRVGNQVGVLDGVARLRRPLVGGRAHRSGLGDADRWRGGDGFDRHGGGVAWRAGAAEGIGTSGGGGIDYLAVVDVGLGHDVRRIGGAGQCGAGGQARGGRARASDVPDARVVDGDRRKGDVAHVRHQVAVGDGVAQLRVLLVGRGGDRRGLVYDHLGHWWAGDNECGWVADRADSAPGVVPVAVAVSLNDPRLTSAWVTVYRVAAVHVSWSPGASPGEAGVGHITLPMLGSLIATEARVDVAGVGDQVGVRDRLADEEGVAVATRRLADLGQAHRRRGRDRGDRDR